jgi:uncharacterized protein (DUF2141 family)
MIGSSAIAADAGSLTVNITGLKNDKGTARIAVFNSAEAFATKMNAAAAFRKTPAPIANNQASATFTDLPYGEYAVKYYHDEDNSGDFKTNMLGIPKVEYGFSNNPNASHGAPSYDKAKFTLNAPQTTIEIKTQHAF